MRTITELLDREASFIPAPNRDSRWSEYDSEESYARSLRCSLGVYQDGVLLGEESVSGSTRKGPWGSANKRSRQNLIKRMREAGLIVTIERRGKRDILCVRKGGVSRETP